MSEILDKDGKPTSVLCIAPTGLERLCRTTQDLEQFLASYPSCQMFFERKEDEDTKEHA